ncbi:MAG: efflux RND transporter periplasmic adaptor subunit, partial [Eubacteriales bacterium]|nr:efflux RND transporter periplasmic adaptor subunit [Eubacteriales bacterium]
RMGAMGGPGGMTQTTAATVVKASVPETGDLSVTSSLTGTVEAADVVYVYAKAAGDVTAVHVKAGDTVRQGQVICEIDTDQVESAKNSLDSAQVSLSQAQSNLSRMQILYDGGDLSAQEYEQYANAVKTAQLQYNSAKLAYDRQVEYSTVTAPIGGRVESCEVEVYDHVNQSGQLCVIAGEGENRITFYVSQRIVNSMKEGDSLEVVKNGTTYPGTVSEISTIVDSESGLFKVKAEMANTDEIAIGSTVKLNVVTDRTENAMLVPVNAVYYSGGSAYVYLYKDGKAEMAPVEVGLYDSDKAEILSGLTSEDMVIGTWSSNLYEGASVRLYGESGSAADDGADPRAAEVPAGAAALAGEKAQTAENQAQ